MSTVKENSVAQIVDLTADDLIDIAAASRAEKALADNNTVWEPKALEAEESVVATEADNSFILSFVLCRYYSWKYKGFSFAVDWEHGKPHYIIAFGKHHFHGGWILDIGDLEED